MSELRTRLESVATAHHIVPEPRVAPAASGLNESQSPVAGRRPIQPTAESAAGPSPQLSESGSVSAPLAAEQPSVASFAARAWGLATVAALASAWAGLFGWLAITRYLAGGAHAEDLGFTDQVLANFVRGQFFRMSIYQGATWNTEIDISRLARPDSLLAFHFEPMLVLLAPLYAIGGGATWLLALQAAGVAAGAWPAYRLGTHNSGSPAGGVAVALAYLLSPLGQWAVLDDFHTSTLAAPLLLLAIERLVVRGSAAQALAVVALAATAREDVGLGIAALGLVLLIRPHAWVPDSWSSSSSASHAAARLPSDALSVTTERHLGRHAKGQKRHAGVVPTSQIGLACVGLGLGFSILAALVMRRYSGSVSPFDVRYASTLGAGLGASVAALARPSVSEYLGTLLLSGGWLGLLSPLTLVPALPGLALNVLSSSPWMVAGKAHYSSLILPFIAVGAAAGLNRLRGQPSRVHLASAALVVTSLVGYVLAGAGPLAGNYAPARVTEHALRTAMLADSLPADSSVSASTALVPRLTRRPSVFVFPAELDVAEFVFVDLRSSPAPTSAGDVFLRIRALLADGGWSLNAAEDGLLLLQRVPEAPPTDIGDLARILAPQPPANFEAATQASYLNGQVSLLSATLEPAPDGAIDVDGPRGLLRTTWRAEQPLSPGTRLDFWLELRDGQRLHVWDIAPLWWNPPERWQPGQPVTVEIPDVPMRQFVSWQAAWTTQ